tara:strand:- start:78 stop:308 length:231 start_codon:yes stop_codon:yes gene_type:complete
MWFADSKGWSDIDGGRFSTIEGFCRLEVVRVTDQRGGRSSSISKRYDDRSLPVFEKLSEWVVAFPTSAEIMLPAVD